ncbi:MULTISPECIES: TetR/AcrR family transcriptional regulator [Lactobacillus]|uniref:TetR/AcrR family transcriptional regulator n=1 Tax=Lactobacillus TaxID=1578 RepID=UPI0023BE1936|nr:MULTISPECIES: TetR/AcrR family transcriptional regulator [Lactobacillus]MDE7050300.1 TetR/AcrR family transcriptional regulator [Lactobacillus sp.]
MSENKTRKTDRRTLYTIKVIKDAFIKLVKEEGYSKITITQICRNADITRSTFYLHFSSITDVLNTVLDDALFLVDENTFNLDNKNYSFDYLNKNESLVPACQRVGDTNKYQKLLMDPDLSEYIIGRIIKHERNKVIPAIIEKTGLNAEDAETLFIYVIHGSFAVNRANHFKKNEKWAHDVQLLNQFTKAGYQQLKKKH